MSPHAKKLALLTAAWLAVPMGITFAQESEPTSPEGSFCGGIAGITCPEGYSCVDDPRDDCDPKNSGADCSGICTAESGLDAPQRGRQYVSKDPDQCAAIRFYCEAGQEPFFNDRGCGCQPVAQ
ncbi:hypothetical protein [Myxococcus sp. RHSTA-1-4]|uniref:hypothetical protein n=1 Tax=Myxococcus sp. RHSTA-1-4 TaxID=2874601 RepID=UPI001CBCCC16|nr:hypothetical protein [Myxococcus sp. RHSTA-1-4]MBZ4421482.1 hypothetical protein [Myxococcus sp. RHSTA-1-4]